MVLEHKMDTRGGTFNNSAAVCGKDDRFQKYFMKQFVNETYRKECSYYVAYKQRSSAVPGVEVNRPARFGSSMGTPALDCSSTVPYRTK